MGGIAGLAEIAAAERPPRARGLRLAKGRYETMRPGSRDQQAVRPDNMRELLDTFRGLCCWGRSAH